ncbi:MAG TPA: response regulator transcription factor [Puia sp.]|jgi:DNA-binding NarL/FixJ family response regulator
MGARERLPLRILIADQHRIIRAGIKALLAETGSWQRFETSEAETSEETIAMLRSGDYSVVLMEYNLPGRGGIKTTEMIHSRWPGLSVIALTDSDDGARAERIIKAGASGCILRNVGVDMLILAIRTVMAGGRFYSNEIAQQLLQQVKAGKRDPLERLTARESQIFRSLLTGLGDKDIAEELGIAKRTVDKHRQHINYKLGTRTPLGLLQAGLRLGLVKVPE